MKTQLTKKKFLLAFLLIAMFQISQKVSAQENREFKKKSANVLFKHLLLLMIKSKEKGRCPSRG